MAREASIRLTEDEIVMVRRALSIASEDGSLFEENDVVEEERRYRIERKLQRALSHISG